MSGATDDAMLANFLQEEFGFEPLPLNTDLFGRFGVDGDDVDEFFGRFVTRFGVDMSDYRWYFHHGEEGFNPAWLFINPPNKRVDRIPITPAVLLEAIRAKRWPMKYPEHRPPGIRWDVILALPATIALIAALAFCAVLIRDALHI